MASSFFQRWNIEQSDEEQKTEFISRLATILGSGTDSIGFSKDEVIKLAFKLGVEVGDIAIYSSYRNEYVVKTRTLIRASTSVHKIARSLEALLDTVDVATRRIVLDFVKQNPESGIRFIKTDNTWKAYPAGEKILDEKLVDETLTFLEGKSSQQFTKALEDYANSKFVESAERTRRALEEYLRDVFNSPKMGLSAGINKLLSKLKEDNYPEHMRSLITKYLKALDMHYNDSSKHQSKTEPYEAEFLIYSVGTMLRLLNEMQIKITGE